MTYLPGYLPGVATPVRTCVAVELGGASPRRNSVYVISVLKDRY